MKKVVAKMNAPQKEKGGSVKKKNGSATKASTKTKPPIKKIQVRPVHTPLEKPDGKSIPKFSDLPPDFTVTGGNKATQNGHITHLATGNKTVLRYSDADLEEFKALLQTRDVKERRELEFIDGCLEQLTGTSGAYSEDSAKNNEEKERLGAQRARILMTLTHIQHALLRINNKTYGRCTITNTLIDKNRLRAHPWATKTVEAKIKINN